MKVFFTENNMEIEEKDNIDALDIISTKFRITIRKSGIKIEDLERGFIMYDKTLDLTQ